MQKPAKIEEAWGRKYPEQVVLAVTKAPDGRINAMAIGWVCIVSDDPPMFLLGIDDPAFTLELIRNNKEFVIAYPSKDMAEETLFFGTVHGDDKILVTDSPYYDSLFYPCGKYLYLWAQIYVKNLGEDIGTVGHFYNIMEWISDEEADRLRREEGM